MSGVRGASEPGSSVLSIARTMGAPASDGRVPLELKRTWHDGTRELVFELLEFLERLAAMTPRPGTNLLICHGVLAARARWRARVVVYGRRVPEPTASTAPLAPDPDGTEVKTRSRAWSWAALCTGRSASTCWRVPIVEAAYA
jgi:hypothetical protein